MESKLIAELEAAVSTVAFPASKEELSDHLSAIGATELTRWLVQSMPGTEFHFGSDVVSTARIALEMAIHRPWPERVRPPLGYTSDDALVDTVRQRLRLCRRTNERLVRIAARNGTITLTGRALDVPSGVMAARVALSAAAGGQVVNLLQVAS